MTRDTDDQLNPEGHEKLRGLSRGRSLPRGLSSGWSTRSGAADHLLCLDITKNEPFLPRDATHKTDKRC